MDNQADKSHEATPYKLDDARKKGQVGRSMEFVSISSLIVMLTILMFMLPVLGSAFANNLTSWLEISSQLVRSDALVVSHTGSFVIAIAWPLMVILLAGVIATILLNLLHVGPVFSLFPMKMDFSKLNPAKGLKKIFSRRGLFETIKALLKLTFIGFAVYFLWDQIKDLVLYSHAHSIELLLKNWRSALISVVSTFLSLFFIFALIDLWHSKKDFAHQMRMSSRDVKDEHKKREGDPEIKNKRKKGMTQLMKTVMSTSNVQNADVIITNPTHVAVALSYRVNKMPLPKLLTKGKGLVAFIIIRKAKRYGIPIFCRPPLARKIYKETQINSYIPVSEQVDTAEVYREVIKMPRSRVFT